MQWEALRDAYVQRFGGLFAAREVTDPRGRWPPFWVLTFWDAEVPRALVVYASFGAPGREVVTVSTAPIFALEEALGGAASGVPAALAPYALVRTPVARTQFKGFLVAPPEDGSFVVAGEGSDRVEVHRLIPVTRAERVLAADHDPCEAYRRVHAADALIADPLRACTVDPRRTELWTRHDAPGLVRTLRDHSAEVERRLAVLRQQGGPAAELEWEAREALQLRAYLGHLQAGLPHLPTDDEVVAAICGAPPAERLARLTEVLVDRGLTGPGDLMTDRVRAGVMEFVGFLVATHPEALRIIEALVGEPILPPATEGNEAVVRSCAKRIVAFVGAAHPTSGRPKLKNRVDRGREEARRTFNPADEVPYENHAWSCMATAVYEGVHHAGSLDKNAVAAGFRTAVDMCGILELDPSSDPPFLRLVTIAQSCCMTMFMSAAAQGKRELDN